jgi:ribosomal protein S12 methylthiotransferase
MIDDELIDLVANEEKILNYLDIPIQHINTPILKRMNRRGTGDEIRELFKKLTERIPNLVLRTSLIAGLPGEGEAEFEELCEYLREAKIPRAGVFPYSPEEGTPAEKMERPDEETAKVRLIVPHSQGTADASSSVTPYYYELTYQRER